ncbi:hypothetical protein [Caballeronia sp. TF1N1]|uniref:hypothetical protein n=1 Tax=Caballeronia sp. TF1N1 TaxID=2878153 RepID=UPI001FD36447|nr:hypothetical protein [Caballeronia sp. TF1N1]
MPLSREEVAKLLQASLEQLIQDAAENNIVLTIELVSDLPLAMGNYHMVGHARPARELA